LVDIAEISLKHAAIIKQLNMLLMLTKCLLNCLHNYTFCNTCYYRCYYRCSSYRDHAFIRAWNWIFKF